MNTFATQIFRLYQYVYDSRKHLLEMLEDRGYNVDHLKNYTTEEIKIMLKQHIDGKFGTIPEIGPLDILLEKTVGKNTEKIYIKYRLEDKFKATTNLISQVNDIYTNIINAKDTLIILNISRVLMKIGVKDKVDEDFVNDLYNRKGYFIQLFGLENFLINVSKHQFVPKHRVLSKQEVDELLDKFKIEIDNIPTIKRDDAQAKYIGLKQNQICEIIVDNITSGRTIKYRLCVI